MSIENSFARNLLDEIIRLGLFQSDVVDGGILKPNTDRAELYTALINELIADASSEGIHTLRNDVNDNEAIEDVYCQLRHCDQLGGGCTCEECTKQIAAVAGWDTHAFEDDCERIDETQRQQDIAARSMILRREIG